MQKSRDCFYFWLWETFFNYFFNYRLLVTIIFYLFLRFLASSSSVVSIQWNHLTEKQPIICLSLYQTTPNLTIICIDLLNSWKVIILILIVFLKHIISPSGYFIQNIRFVYQICYKVATCPCIPWIVFEFLKCSWFFDFQ